MARKTHPKGNNQFHWAPILRSMEVGESFLVPEKSGWYPDPVIRQYGRKRGWKLTIRRTPEGIRCWRMQ
jgi:hypothetical protein